ncbi:MAG: hypothetical protein HY246_11760 [Proteobacteria bacterium]|nr:hypothetical protein [Pseudomonadota bacterium]
MRLDLNLPLFAAAYAGTRSMNLLLWQEAPGWPQVSLGLDLPIWAALFWLLLGVAVLGCAVFAGFDWLPASLRGFRLHAVVLAGYVAVVLLFITPFNIATAGDAWAAGIDVSLSATVWAARVVACGLPLVAFGYIAWLVNAPVALRDAAAPRYVTFVAVAALGLAVAGIGVIFFVEDVAHRNQVAANHRQLAEPGAEVRQALARQSYQQRRQAYPAFTSTAQLAQ